MKKGKPRVAFFCLLLPLLILVHCAQKGADNAPAQCGEFLREKNGTISTPNFPKPFPAPLKCRWILQGTNQSQIVLVFTQYVLLHSLHIYEYDYFENDTVYINKQFIGEISAENEVGSIVSYRNYVVLDLKVTDPTNANLKVDQYLTDYHGFNITYLMLPMKATLPALCSLHHCSYLGNCLVTSDYSKFHCDCFQGFWGSQCHRGPHCDPDSGINSCLNGGQCRYLYGSQFNACECPPNYMGKLCENHLISNKKGHSSSVCSHFMNKSPVSNNSCDPENKTSNCLDEERFRIFVQMNILSRDVFLENMSELEYYRQYLSDQVTLWLENSKLSSADSFIISNISEEKIDFHFYIDKKELMFVNQSLHSLVQDGNLFGIAVNQSQMIVQIKPEMKFLSLEMSSESPIKEGGMLTLTCTARGSENIQFKWFKNGKPLNLTVTHRNAWEIHLPETIQGKHISVLNIDGITIYDKGKFTCEIIDFGCKVNGSIILNVLPLPVVQVDPLSVSMVQGSSQTLRCISAVDKNDESLTYSWLKNNRMFHENDKEIVENIHPTGSHLYIRNAMASTNYTCQITNKAGTSAKTVYVYVVEDANAKSCPSDKLNYILWNKTFGGIYNLQNCPENLASMKKESEEGIAKRYCNCTEFSCQWEPPNFAKCHWSVLIKIYNDLKNLQLGYMEKTLTEIFENLYTLTVQTKSTLLAGDLDLASTILHVIVKTAKDFPSLLVDQLNIEKLVELLNILLEETLRKTDEEKKELQVGKQLLQLIETLAHFKRANFLNAIDIQFSKIDLNIQVNMKTKGTTEEPVLLPQPVLAVHVDQSLIQLMDCNISKKVPSKKLISDVYSYFPLVSSPDAKMNFIINIPHNFNKQLSANEIVYCMSLEKEKLDSSSVTLQQNSCSMIQTEVNQTQCLCTLPGHYTLVSVIRQYNETTSERIMFQVTLFVAHTLCTIALLLVLIVYLKAKRCLLETKNAIHFNFTISLVGVHTVCILCLMQPKKEMLCLCGKMILQLFTVSAFTFLLLDAIQILIDIHARQHSHIIIGTVKFIIIGWGLPTLSVICAIVTLQVAGFDHQCSSWCWWSPMHQHFYSVIITLILLVIGQSGILAFCLVIITQWKDEWSYRDRRKFIFMIGQSISLSVILFICICVSIFSTEKQVHSSKGLVIFFNFILTVVIISFFVLLKKSIRPSIFRKSLIWKNKNIFRFAHQETPDINHVQAETERIHEYCDRVDRERYTAEHKRQLRFLLSNNNLCPLSNGDLADMTKENRLAKKHKKTVLDGQVLLGADTVQFSSNALVF
ncbi:uncharacterized protein LOC106063426 isoform X2 [Biomphalaria glabrata]|uniref:Uncharacterized protein LOC106063426 isoform X2 n=1 Tax=Biomphalaria glabrata TaxID=6526 RepID=A0A9W3AEF6_BIOGL|nr:uncharacterized protein LOC106063426 isoform X2 [Biomphalaria glabrata]